MSERKLPSLECDVCGKQVTVERPFDEVPAGWISFQSDDILIGHCCSEKCFESFDGKDGVEILQRGYRGIQLN